MDLNSLFDLSPKTLKAMPNSIMACLGIDTHIHGRTPADGRSRMVIEACAGELEAIVDIANVPGVVTGEDCKQRCEMLESFVPKGKELKVYCTPLINNTTDPMMLIAGWKNHYLVGIKIFWEKVSNAYGQFITRAEAIRKLIRSLPEGFVVTVHAECAENIYTGERLPIADREWWCIQNQVEMMVRWNKGLVWIIRHVSDWRTLEWIERMWNEGYRVYAELSPQYLMQVDDDIFLNENEHAELQCCELYWPRPKSERSRKALQGILLRCPPWLIYGSDLALHIFDLTQEKNVKVNNNGKAVGGLTFLPAAAKSILIDFCLSKGKPEILRKIMVEQPSVAYGITLKGTEVKYIRKDWTVPTHTTGKVWKNLSAHIQGTDMTTEVEVRSVNFLRDKTMHWQRVV
jgi:dihydroorotase